MRYCQYEFHTILSPLGDIVLCILYNEVDFMRSEAQKKADKKYKESGKSKYKTVGASLHIKQADQLQAAADALGLTLSKYLVLSALYCSENQISFGKLNQE